LAYPEETPEIRERLFTLQAFLDGMDDQTLSFEVYKQKVTTLRDALAGALRLEVWQTTHQRKEVSASQGIRTSQVEGG